jgi:hypothetical protein
MASMRMNRILGALGLGAVLSGCTLYESATRNLAFETVLCVDYKVSCVRDRRLATAAWTEIQQAHADQHFSADYVRGFKRGFAEFLRTGAPAGPPPIPPHWYWKVCYETPEGHQAMEDWMAGFTQGVAVARATGERALVAVPTSVPPPGVVTMPPPAELSLPVVEAAPAVELPPPQKEAAPAPEDKGRRSPEWKPNASPYAPSVHSEHAAPASADTEKPR